VWCFKDRHTCWDLIARNHEGAVITGLRWCIKQAWMSFDSWSYYGVPFGNHWQRWNEIINKCKNTILHWNIIPASCSSTNIYALNHMTFKYKATTFNVGIINLSYKKKDSIPFSLSLVKIVRSNVNRWKKARQFFIREKVQSNSYEILNFKKNSNRKTLDT